MTVAGGVESDEYVALILEMLKGANIRADFVN